MRSGRPGKAALHEEASGPTTGGVVLLVASLCAIYLISQFLRNSVGVIGPDISSELSLSPEALGILSSAFFFSFAAAQVPLGVAIDRYGPKVCMLASVGLAILGCILFATAQSFSGMIAARILMGLGCSSFFMAPLTIYTRWFSPSRFSTLTGIQLGFGTLGTLVATAPLAFSTEQVGWRGTFMIVALATAAFGILVALAVRDDPPGRKIAALPPQSLLKSFAGLLEVVRVPGFAQVFVMQMFAYSSLITVLGLWGGPFVTDVLGFNLRERGNILFVMAAAHVAGSFLWGPTDRLFGSLTAPVALGVISTTALFVVLALFGDRGGAGIYLLFAALGLAGAYVPVLTAHGRSLFNQQTVGRGMTMINLATIGGVSVLQAATGAIIGQFDPIEGPLSVAARPFAAYQMAFGFLALSLLSAWLFYRTAPVPRPKAP